MKTQVYTISTHRSCRIRRGTINPKHVIIMNRHTIVVAGDSVDLRLLRSLDLLIAFLMESREPVSTVSKLFDVAYMIIAKLNGQEPPRYADNPELVHLYLLLRKMVKKHIFDINVMKALISVTSELKRK